MYSGRVYGFFNNIIVIIVFYRIYWEHVIYYRITDYKGKSEDFQCLSVDMASASISTNISGELMTSYIPRINPILVLLFMKFLSLWKKKAIILLS
jgi:hypothetical protein